MAIARPPISDRSQTRVSLKTDQTVEIEQRLIGRTSEPVKVVPIGSPSSNYNLKVSVNIWMCRIGWIVYTGKDYWIDLFESTLVGGYVEEQDKEELERYEKAGGLHG